MKVVGNNKAAIITAYNQSSPQIPQDDPHPEIEDTTDTAVEENTPTNMTIKKKLLIQIVKQIANIDDRPIIRYPISNIDDGLSGQTSLAFKYRILQTVT